VREDTDIFKGDLLSSKQFRPRQCEVFARAPNAVTEVAAKLRKARKPAICRLRLSMALIQKPTSLIAACRRITVAEILGCYAHSAVIRTQRVHPTASAKWSPSLRQHAKALGIPMNIYRSSFRRTILRSRQVYARIRHLAKLIDQSSMPVRREVLPRLSNLLLHLPILFVHPAVSARRSSSCSPDIWERRPLPRDALTTCLRMQNRKQSREVHAAASRNGIAICSHAVIYRS